MKSKNVSGAYLFWFLWFFFPLWIRKKYWHYMRIRDDTPGRVIGQVAITRKPPHYHRKFVKIFLGGLR